MDDAGVGVQELEHEAVAHAALVVQRVEQGEVPEGRPPLVHELGLALGMEVLGHLAHDAHDLPLPGFQEGRVLLDEVQQVLLGLPGEAGLLGGPLLPGAGRERAPELVHLGLEVGLALLLARALLGEGEPRGPPVAVNAQVHEGVARVQEALHGVLPVALLALGDVVPGEDQVVDDGPGAGPLAEQMVALEEGVVAVGRVGDDQGLHGQGVLLHEVGDAGVGVDDDLVGQAHLPAPVAVLRGQEVLAEGPVVVVDRHAGRGVGVHHLQGADDLQLVGVGVQAEVPGQAPDGVVEGGDGLEGPLRSPGEHGYTRFRKRSWKTG